MSPKSFQFADGLFSLWTAYYGSWANDVRIVFRVRCDTTPQKRALQKRIECYDRLAPATDWEIEKWIEGHPTLKPLVFKLAQTPRKEMTP